MFVFFFFNDTATTEIYTLSLHDALPICRILAVGDAAVVSGYVGGETQVLSARGGLIMPGFADGHTRSEEHTSELQSQSNLVCRLLLEKKKHIPPPTSASAYRPPSCTSYN